MAEKTFTTAVTFVPGVVTGAAYQALDALGTAFAFDVPESGVIQSAVYYDADDEGLQVDLLFFRASPTQQVDNSAVSLPDTELYKALGRVQFTTFADATNGQFSNVNNIGLAYTAPGGKLWAIAQAQGALNIAAGNLPAFRLAVLPD